ncbi:hypothetical protein EDB81DRAFT_906191 [Dactylonectria macrodidyma]|uniref:Uncharacterized protein n=1 Tax=Dactylonectria macrodidyma TaxID=307937 RepID=A0A9P9E2N0_9HYPO|nr:hypothetical protein EDB81DRAFT_906191 [Dactylonectria macrodidyma]
MAEFGSQPERAKKPHLEQTFDAWSSVFELGRKSGHREGYQEGFEKGYWSGVFSSPCQCDLGLALPSPKDIIDDIQPDSTGECLLSTTKEQSSALTPTPPLISPTSISTKNPESSSLPISISAISQTEYGEAAPTTNDLEYSLALLTQSISPIHNSIPTPEPSPRGHKPASPILQDSISCNGPMPPISGNLSISRAPSPPLEQLTIDWTDDSMFSAPHEGVLSPNGASPASANDTAPRLSNPFDPSRLGSSNSNVLAPTDVSDGDSINSPALKDERLTDAEALTTMSSSPNTSYEQSFPPTPRIDDTVAFWIDELSSPPSPTRSCNLADYTVLEDSEKAANQSLRISHLYQTEDPDSSSEDLLCLPAEYSNRKRSAEIPSNPPSPKRTKNDHGQEPGNGGHGDKSDQFRIEEILVQPKGTGPAFTVSWSRRAGEWVEKNKRGKANRTFKYDALLDITRDFCSITGRRRLGWSPVKLYFKNGRWQGRDVLGDWKIEVQSSSIELVLAMAEERDSLACEAHYVKL